MTGQDKAATPVLSVQPGQLIVIGKRIYGRCAGCDSIVRVNKPLLGALHVCAPDNTEGSG